jgi:hypothetical protein
MTSEGGLILWAIYRTKGGYVARRSLVTEGCLKSLDGAAALRGRDLSAIRKTLLARGFKHRVRPEPGDGDDAAIVEFWM